MSSYVHVATTSYNFDCIDLAKRTYVIMYVCVYIAIIIVQFYLATYVCCKSRCSWFPAARGAPNIIDWLSFVISSSGTCMELVSKALSDFCNDCDIDPDLGRSLAVGCLYIRH